MKIQCECGHLIIDQTDGHRHKAHLISDTQWLAFWDAVDQAIERPKLSAKQRERMVMQLRKRNLFRTAWECGHCGKLYIDGESGELLGYSPDSKGYNHALEK